MFEAFILWVQGFVTVYGLTGVFIVSFLESFIFPVPTATIVAPVTALGVNPLSVAITATIASVIGAFVGYLLGFHVGKPAAQKIFKDKHIKKVEKWYEKYGAWAVLIAALSPVPFKVFTWFSGIFKLDKRKFIIASVIGRFAQFMIAAYAGNILGPWLLSLVGL